MALLRRLWSGRPEDAELRARRDAHDPRAVDGVLRAQRRVRVRVRLRRRRARRQPGPRRTVDDIRVYEPSTRPGAPLPHAWIDDEDGNRRPIKDLVAPGRFLLIAGEDGAAWCDAARELAARGRRAARRGADRPHRGRPLRPALLWLRHRGIERDGAILVRPDRFVAWRQVRAADDPRRRSPTRSAASSPAPSKPRPPPDQEPSDDHRHPPEVPPRQPQDDPPAGDDRLLPRAGRRGGHPPGRGRRLAVQRRGQPPDRAAGVPELQRRPRTRRTTPGCTTPRSSTRASTTSTRPTCASRTRASSRPCASTTG